MKITKRKMNQIINEEYKRLLREQDDGGRPYDSHSFIPSPVAPGEDPGPYGPQPIGQSLFLEPNMTGGDPNYVVDWDPGYSDPATTGVPQAPPVAPVAPLGPPGHGAALLDVGPTVGPPGYATPYDYGYTEPGPMSGPAAPEYATPYDYGYTDRPPPGYRREPAPEPRRGRATIEPDESNLLRTMEPTRRRRRRTKGDPQGANKLLRQLAALPGGEEALPGVYNQLRERRNVSILAQRIERYIYENLRG